MKREIFECSRDRLTIRGHVYGETASGRDVVILSHGFLGNESHVKDYAEAVAEAGFTAVAYDFCGGGIECHSDGKTEEMTVLTEREDLLQVIDAVRERLAPASISLMGCSQGGFVSALTASRLGAKEIRRLVLFYPAFCIPDDARHGQMQTYHFDPAHVPDLLGKEPMPLGGDYARTVMDMDPYQEIRGYKGPVLLIHGTEDDIVNIRYARRAKEVYGDCTYYEIEGAGHGFKGKNETKAIRYLLAFLKQ